MDFDMKRVRSLRMFMRTIEYAVLSFLILYSVFCSYFVFFGGNGLDKRFVVYFLIGAFVFWYEYGKSERNSFSFLARVNRVLLSEGMHARIPKETERNIVQSFFKDKKLEMPIFFTCDEPACFNAYVLRFEGKDVLLVTELTYWKFSPRQIWAMIAHEKGHLLNGDIKYRLFVEKWISEFSICISAFVILKLIMYSLASPEMLSYSNFAYLSLFTGVVCFLCVIKQRCEKALVLIHDILADNSAAKILNSSMWMLECLQLLRVYNVFHGFSLRQKALVWILKK